MKYIFYKLKFFFNHNVAFGIISEENMSIENFIVALFKSSIEYKDFLCILNHMEGKIELYVLLKGDVLFSTSLVPDLSEEELIEFCITLLISDHTQMCMLERIWIFHAISHHAIHAGMTEQD